MSLQNLNLDLIPLSVRYHIQIRIILLCTCALILKLSKISTLLGPHLDLWPALLLYLSLYLTPFVSIIYLFLLGIIHDTLLMIPLGISSALWLLTYFILSLERRRILKQSIYHMWFISALIYGGFAFFYRTIEWLNHTTPWTLSQTISSTIFSVAFTPSIFYLCQKIFIRQMDQ